MRALITGSRMPVAIELVRKLGRRGHAMYGADAIRSAPGGRSKYCAGHFLTPKPRTSPRAFIDATANLLETHRIDRLIPSFEEVYYLAMDRERLAQHAELFFPELPLLRRLHDKVAFHQVATQLGLQVPTQVLARSRTELAAVTASIPRFFARPAYSRGGVYLYTNAGPLADEVRLEDCHPSETNPFVVQPFVDGLDVCTTSVVHHGRVTGHASYVHPMTMEHAGGIVFESVDHPEALEATRRLADATGYHGHLSLDFLQTDGGLVVIECNPRPTQGLSLMSDEMLEAALLDTHPAQTLVAPAGRRAQMSIALIRNMIAHWEEIPASIEELRSGDLDIYSEGHDPLPLLYQLVAYSRVLGFRWRQRRAKRTDIMEGYFHDITWDGETIP